ncbi:MAG: T9SS type A sorting domain-containing protein, partial [Candidatus Marinimicrobia bacterium]|nr:T9SS type A sorting domain-containing protein [Candidatus Neomarinimicrobiota bacterium]
IYPNPFNPETTIRYTLTAPGEVEMTVYDIRGRTVRTLFNKFQETGEHSIIFHASDLPSGVYVCRLQSGNTRTARKMLLLK